MEIKLRNNGIQHKPRTCIIKSAGKIRHSTLTPVSSYKHGIQTETRQNA